MSWKIGPVTLPRNPSTVKVRPAQNIKSVDLLKQMPLLMPFGPATRVLTLEGFIQENGKTADQLETDYLLPLQNLVEKGIRIPIELGDDGMAASGNWVATAWGSGMRAAPTLYDDEIVKSYGLNSLQCTIGAGVSQYSGVQRTFSPARDWSKHDFIGYRCRDWIAGNLAIELYDGLVTEQVVIGISSLWKRYVTLLSLFTGVNLANITRIRLGFTSSYFGWLDRLMVGAGVLVDAPGTRHDGIYVLKEFPWEERGGLTTAFPYKLDLWCVDDYY